MTPLRCHSILLIDHSGGGKEIDENGKRIQKSNQEKTEIAVAFERTRDFKVPVAVIAGKYPFFDVGVYRLTGLGQGNHLSPSALPHYYNVLDWFHVTDVWYDSNNGIGLWMARLEKINLKERSWWSAKTAQLPQSSFQQPKAPTQTCACCKKPSKEIYKEGWACLDRECAQFFKFGPLINSSKLHYNHAFLNERTEFKGVLPGPLVPPPPTDESQLSRDEFGIETEFRQGIVCPWCGCCTRRIEWRQWSCENDSCDYVYRLKQRVVPITEAISQGMDSTAPARPELVRGNIRTRYLTLGRYTVHEYIIPDEIGEPVGTVRQFKAIPLTNQQPDGPDDLFHQMQENDFGLKRSASRCKGGRYFYSRC